MVWYCKGGWGARHQGGEAALRERVERRTGEQEEEEEENREWTRMDANKNKYE